MTIWYQASKMISLEGALKVRVKMSVWIEMEWIPNGVIFSEEWYSKNATRRNPFFFSFSYCIFVSFSYCTFFVLFFLSFLLFSLAPILILMASHIAHWTWTLLTHIHDANLIWIWIGSKWSHPFSHLVSFPWQRRRLFNQNKVLCTPYTFHFHFGSEGWSTEVTEEKRKEEEREGNESGTKLRTEWIKTWNVMELVEYFGRLKEK